jgi:hypothetical protein
VGSRPGNCITVNYRRTHYIFFRFSIAASTLGWRDKNCSRRTSLTVCVTRGLLTTWTLPLSPLAFLTKRTSAPKPELSTKSIVERSKMIWAGPSSMYLLRTLRKVGSEKASKSPVRRKIWHFPLTSRVPLRLTVRVSDSAMGGSS